MSTQSYQEQLSANLTQDASAFELSFTPLTNTLMLFVNGVFQRANYDYSRSGSDILFTSLIPSAFDVRSAYQYDATSCETGCPQNYRLVDIQETLPITNVNGASSFTLAQEPYPENYFIFVNGIVQRDTIDYNIDDSTLTFASVLPSAYVVYADYRYSVSTDPVVPAGIRGSTNLNHVITSYDLMADRIKMQIGWPVVNIELCDDQIYDFINQACEWYSKYAGQTEEYLVFCSDQYQCGYGIKLDTIINRITDFHCRSCDTISPMVTGQYYDCDLNNYRKVAGIFSLDPAGGGFGGGTGTEVLFNMDYLFAQQAYFGQMMGGMGYDLVTWHLLKSWLQDRQKLFATESYVNFDPRTQVMKLIPEPSSRLGNSSTGNRFIGVIGVRMERSIAQLVQERWVQRYALALTKIALAFIRGKFGGVTLFGGSQVNSTDLMTQGLEEKKAMEEELMNGFGEAEPPRFLLA